MRILPKTVVLAFALVACASPPRSASMPGPASDASPESSCATSWTATAEWAQQLMMEPSHGISAARFSLAEASVESDPEGTQMDSEVVVARDMVRVDSQVLGGAELRDAFARTFVRSQRLSRLYSPDHVPMVIVGVTREAPWWKVVEVWNDLQRAGFTRVSFAFNRPHPMQEPGWSWRSPQLWLEARAAYLHSDDYIPPPVTDDDPPPPPALQQRDKLVSTLAVCPELVRRVRGESHEDFVASLGSFDDPCRCRILDRSLRSILWAIHPADRSTVRVIGIPQPAAESDPRAVVIEAPAEALWSEVAAQVVQLPRGASATFRAAR